MAYAILRIAKHSSNGSLGGMTKHNARELEVPNANRDLTHLNADLIGTGDYVHDVNEVIKREDLQTQKNSVKAIEHVITSSPEFWKEIDLDNILKTKDNEGRLKINDFRKRSIKFLKDYYGPHSKIASLSLHMDEATPHIHAFVVPITKGKLKGGKEVKRLSAKQFIDGRKKLSEMQDLFAKEMAPLGLERGIKGSKAKHQRIQKLYSNLNYSMDKAELSHMQVPEIQTPPRFVASPTKYAKEQNELVRQQLQEHIKKYNEFMDAKAISIAADQLNASRLKSVREMAKVPIEALKMSLENSHKTIKSLEVKLQEKDNSYISLKLKAEKAIGNYEKDISALEMRHKELKEKHQERLINLKARERDLKDLLSGRMPKERADELILEFKQAERSSPRKRDQGMSM